MSYYLGLDVGGTNIRAAVATGAADIFGRSTGSTPQRSTAPAVTDEILRVVERACEDGGIDPTEVSAAGIGSAGPLRQDTGIIVAPANVFGADSRIELARPLRELLRTDAVVLRNDATCGVIAEHRFSDSATENMVYITISTGIGAGVVVDGDVLFGHGGNAAEVGHMTVDPTGTMECGCGRGGHWEAYCGGANVPDYAAHLAHGEPVETTLPDAAAAFAAKDVFDRADGDQLADLVVDRMGRWNAIGFANVVQAFAPTYVAVGGAVALNNPDAVLDPVRDRLPDHVLIDVPEIGVSELGDEGVLRGALLIARR